MLYKIFSFSNGVISPKSLKLINNVSSFVECDRKMSTALDTVSRVDIDPSGVFKYILVNVYDKTKVNVEPIAIVRGYKRCHYHSDIYSEVRENLHPLGCEPLGGGRISHDAENSTIHIFGFSQAYGKANHEVTAKLIKKAYPSTYTITFSDRDI